MLTGEEYDITYVWYSTAALESWSRKFVVLARNFRPIPSTLDIGQSLAQRVRALREFRNMTVRDLATSTRFPIARIEDIEAGIETWLSTTERQILARALGVDAIVIAEVEKRVLDSPDVFKENADEESYARLVSKILAGARTLDCPNCGDKLKCSVQDGLDMEGYPIQFAKASCQKCPYFLK
jgi:transcriptional regulator with XRE-family HTH domain